MANVFDVAAYILEKEGEMTTMKLQKLCYYAQAWSLAWEGRPLFDEDFQAWANGPVCRELYNKHAGYFEIKDMHFFDREKSSSGLTKKEKDIIKDVLETYGDKTARWLSDLTHMERPWKEARGDLAKGARGTTVIRKDVMQDYYAGL